MDSGFAAGPAMNRGGGPSDFQKVPSSVLSFGDSVDFNSTNRR